MGVTSVGTATAHTSDIGKEIKNMKDADFLDYAQSVILDLNSSDADVMELLKESTDRPPAFLTTIQSFMQSRMQKIGTISNMMKALHEAAMSIIRNLRT